MKVVYNTNGFGLRLNEAELKMFCTLRGYTLRNHTHPLSSTTTWFVEVDWLEFRSDPLLVRLVENNMMSNKDLAVVEVDGEWDLATDWQTYERVEMVGDCPTCMSCGDDIADYEDGYCVYCHPAQFETEGEEA